jgi:deazaflavin-dependent oxidoreductase (nitroreductase family)
MGSFQSSMWNPYNAFLRAAGQTRAFAFVMRCILPPVDAHFEHRKHTVASLGTGLPVLYLTTTGRRTGEPRTAPLLYAEGHGADLLLAATNWGQRHHPGWSSNLDAHPDVSVTVGGEKRRMHARRCTPEEVDRYWPRLVEIWPAYDAYRRRSGREIRVYVLEPSGSAAAHVPG